MQLFFKRVWTVCAPERIRASLWLVSHQAIMTNKERFRRHISDTDVCPVCKGGFETILQVLRDCPAMEGIWTRLVPVGKRQAFFARSLFECLYENLGDGVKYDNGTWATMFAVGVWWAWKWRCGNVFGDTRTCMDIICFLKDYAKEVTGIEAAASVGGGSIWVEQLIKWEAPGADWYKLNTDGASHGNLGLATAGGLIRNGEGEWCGGFALNIGRCTPPLAELCGVYYGLYIDWEKRISCLELEVDSEIVVGFLKTGIGETHLLSFLVRLCHGFLANDWIVRVSHVYKEVNRLADELANYAFSLPLGFHSFNSVPMDVALILNEDVIGHSLSR